MSFDKVGRRWTILGTASEVHRSTERSQILSALMEAGDVLSPQDITAATGMSPTNVWQMLHRMTADGDVEKVGRGKYRHPDAPTVDPRSGR